MLQVLWTGIAPCTFAKGTFALAIMLQQVLMLCTWRAQRAIALAMATLAQGVVSGANMQTVQKGFPLKVIGALDPGKVSAPTT